MYCIIEASLTTSRFLFTILDSFALCVFSNECQQPFLIGIIRIDIIKLNNTLINKSKSLLFVGCEDWVRDAHVAYFSSLIV